MKLTRYTDIPKFPHSSYRVTVSLDYLIDHLNGYFNDYDIDMNPEFQRGHVWTEDQQIAFMEFKLKGGTSGSDIYFNHTNWNEGNIFEGTMVCVDGLQRLTAASAFLFGKIPLFGSYIHEYEQRLRMAGAINLFTFHIAGLKTEKEVLEWYLSINEGGTPHSEREIQKVRKMINEL